MRCKRRPMLYGSFALALLLGTTGSLKAEPICAVPSPVDPDECLYVLLLGITEEPDPITIVVEPEAASEDGGGNPEDLTLPTATTPQVATGNGMTVAVWAESTEGNSDIVFSEWRPGGWQNHLLTLGGVEERDPRVDIASDGTVYVSWWEDEEPVQIRVARRDPVTEDWSQPEAFSGMFGRRPSVLATTDEIMVAYEREAFPRGQEVVVRRVDLASAVVSHDEDVIARTTREVTLDVQLHMHGDRAFIDWIHRNGTFGYTEYRGDAWGVNLNARPLTQRAVGSKIGRSVAPFLTPTQ